VESTISNLSSWLLLIALGAFHGLNPAMGWLFAVALGLYRQSRGVVLVSLIPIALGHAASIAVVVYAVMALGMAIDADAFRILSGVLLIAWGLATAGISGCAPGCLGCSPGRSPWPPRMAPA
jgi:hypothetical protein